MSRLFVSKLPKVLPAEEVEVFLKNLIPEASHIQLLHGSFSGEHKGHAYVHFADEVEAGDTLQRLNSSSPPMLHGMPIQIKCASRVDMVDEGVVPPLPLPPQLAQFVYSKCVCMPSSVADSLEGVVTRCDLPGGVTAVAFDTEEQAAVAHQKVGGATRCLPPLLPELLSSGVKSKRRCSEETKHVDNTPSGRKHTLEDGGDLVASYEQQGFLPLSPAQVLQFVQDLMDGSGRVAVRDNAGNVAVLNLPPYVSLLE